MRRTLSLGALLLSSLLAGCTGSAEIPPTTEQSKNISNEDMTKAMKESLDKMPPEMRAKMQQQMNNMPMMKGQDNNAGPADGGAAASGTTATP